MRLLVEVRQSLGAFHLDASIAADGGVTALFGRSGSGKTSLMRVIAGLARPQWGRVVFDETVLLDTERSIFVPPHKRHLGYVFQEARLFPHLSVRGNLGYGRWFSSPARDREDYDRVVELLGIAPLLDRAPANLSGGERQRVAIGRALLASPQLLLMDEPLASLDEERKGEILPYLERLRNETDIPIVYVSHSVAEVGRLADRVAIMAGGRVAAIGTPSEVLKGKLLSAHERRESGSILAGIVRSVDGQHGLATVAADGLLVAVSDPALHEGQSVRLHIPERDVMIATVMPVGLSALNVFEGVISTLEDEGSGVVRVCIASGDAQIFARVTAFSCERLGLIAGRPVYAVVKSVALAR
nr:molybdenum ABC transporter ATP-binding protein [Rhizobium sp. Q54]